MILSSKFWLRPFKRRGLFQIENLTGRRFSRRPVLFWIRGIEQGFCRSKTEGMDAAIYTTGGIKAYVSYSNEESHLFL